MTSEAVDSALTLDGTSFMARVLKVVRKNTAHPEAATSPINARSLQLRWKHDGQTTNASSPSGLLPSSSSGSVSIDDSQDYGQTTCSELPSPSPTSDNNPLSNGQSTPSPSPASDNNPPSPAPENDPPATTTN